MFRLAWTKSQLILALLNIALLLGMFVRLISHWEDIPPKIAVLSAEGEVISDLPKLALLNYPMISATIALTLGLILALPPGYWNIPMKIQEQNAQKVYSLIRTAGLIVLTELTAYFTLMQTMRLYGIPEPRASIAGVVLVISCTMLFLFRGISRANSQE